MPLYNGKLQLDVVGHRASLCADDATMLMTRDTTIGVVTDQGVEQAYQRYRNMLGVGNGGRISVSGTKSAVNGYGIVLYI